MADNAYTWQFRAEGGQEASSLFSIIERLDKILQRLTQRENDVQSTFRSMGSASRTAADATKIFTSAVADVTKETVKTANGVTTISTEYDRMGKVLRRTVDDVNTLGSTTSKTRKIFDAQGNVLKRTSDTLTDFREKTSKATATTRQGISATKAATASKRDLFKALTKGAGIWNTWNKAVDFAAKRIRQLYTGFTALFSKVQEVGGAFERSRAEIEVLAKAKDKDGTATKALIDQTKLLGKTTEFTAQQAADGAVVLLKSGESASSAWGKLKTAMQAAQATGLDVAKTAAIGNHAFKIFGDNLGKVGDRTMDYDTAMRVMIASANAADVTVSQLDSSLVKGSDLLARLGIPLTRVNAGLGIMADKGIKGSTAMRHLVIMTQRLAGGIAPADKALKKLGISAYDSQGNFRDLGALMGDINAALDLEPTNEKMSIMKDLFGAAAKSVGSLLDAGVSGFDELEDKIQGNLEVMTQLEEAKADTMIGSYKKFRSTVEAVYVELTGILGVPIKEFWNALASILSIVSDRIATVSARFQDGKGELSEWVEAISSGSFKGIFDGLPGDLAPHIETLKTLFKGLADSIVELLKSGLSSAAIEIWDAFFTDEIVSKAAEMGKAMGKAILDGILGTGIGKAVAGVVGLNVASAGVGLASSAVGLAGAVGISGAAIGAVAAPVAIAGGVGIAGGLAANYAIEKVSGGYEEKQEQRGIKALTDHLSIMIAKKKEVANIPLTDRTEEDTARLKRIQQQIVITGSELEKLGGIGTEGGERSKLFAQQISEAKRGLHKESPTATTKEDIFPETAIQDTEREKEKSLATEKEQPVDREAQLRGRAETLAKQEELIAAERKQKEALEDSNAVLAETQIEINNVGSAFEKWILNPVNVFQQKLMGIKEQFSGIVDNLQGKKVDLEEKFGLKSSEQANAKRAENLQASLKRDEKMLTLAQTPEEEMKVRERMAGKAEKLADISEGPQKDRFAKEAAKYLEQAEESAGKAEELQIKKIEIEQENARKNLAEYEKLVNNAETAGSRSGYLEQLKETYMSLGPEYQEKAVQAQEDWKRSKAEAAAEESENFKRIAEANEIQVELLQRVADALDSSATSIKEQMHIPPDAGYAEAV